MKYPWDQQQHVEHLPADRVRLVLGPLPRGREEIVTCRKCHCALLELRDRLERSGSDQAHKVWHVYTLQCAQCGMETEPFIVIPYGGQRDGHGCITGHLGQGLRQGED